MPPPPSRRTVLRLLGATGALIVSGCASRASDTGNGSGAVSSPIPPDPSGSVSSGPATASPPPGIGFGVWGRVRDAAGRPVADAFVEAVPIGNAPAVPDRAVFTDSAGVYAWPLRQGRYLLRASHARGRAEAVADVPAGAAVRVDLILR